MKKLLILTILATAFSASQIVTIIDKGKERKIYIPSSNIKARYTNEQNSSAGIIVLFKSGANIEEFKSKYSLELEKKLVIGYYIFNNRSNLDDIELISKITKESRDIIKSIRPNWALGMMPR